MTYPLDLGDRCAFPLTLLGRADEVSNSGWPSPRM
jgi:hypothetical protein